MLTPEVDCDQESYIGAQRRRDVVVSHQPPDYSPCEGTSQRSTCKRYTDVFSAAPIPSTARCSFYLQYTVVASGEESQNCINPYAKPPSLKALRQRLRGSHTLHSVAVEVPAASLRGNVVLQPDRSQEPYEYTLECFKIVNIFLQDPKNNASIDL
jgi:hypothetical protein